MPWMLVGPRLLVWLRWVIMLKMIICWRATRTISETTARHWIGAYSVSNDNATLTVTGHTCCRVSWWDIVGVAKVYFRDERERVLQAFCLLQRVNLRIV